MDIWNPIIGETYYAVGPLQNKENLEEWTFTNDMYDQTRKKIGNMFKTLEEATHFKKHIEKYKLAK